MNGKMPKAPLETQQNAAQESCCGIDSTALPEGKPDSPIRREWNTYRREVGRLLAEGHEGRYVLIKGEAIVGIWDTREEARAVAATRYLLEPHLIHPIRSREPLLRGPVNLSVG